MEMTGSRTLPTSPSDVWARLNDTGALQRAIPGCESLDRHSETEMTGVVAIKVGPVSAKFTGDVTLSDIDAPNGYTISGSGKGGVAGNVSGSAKVSLAPADGGGTVLSYTVEAKVSGKLAQLGGRLIDATAAKLAGQFFDTFEREIAEAAPAPAEAEEPVAATTPAPAAKAGKSTAWIWIAAALVAAAVLVAYALR